MGRKLKLSKEELVSFLSLGDKSEKDVMKHFNCTSMTARNALIGGTIFGVVKRKQIIGACPHCNKVIKQLNVKPYFVYSVVEEDERGRSEYDG